jgi:hypothetical protein
VSATGGDGQSLEVVSLRDQGPISKNYNGPAESKDEFATRFFISTHAIAILLLGGLVATRRKALRYLVLSMAVESEADFPLRPAVHDARYFSPHCPRE